MNVGDKIKPVNGEVIYTVTEVTDEFVIAEAEPVESNGYITQDTLEIPLNVIDEFKVV